MLKYKSSPLFRSGILSVLVYLGSTLTAFGTLKTPALSGNWSNPLTWGGASSPGSSDNITIPSGVVIVLDTDITVKELIVSANATINWVPGKRLTIQNNFTVHGTVNMNGGLITLSSPGLQFTLGAGSVFTWDPGTNTSAEATLFTRGVENFAPTSTLIIKKWYNYAIALGTVVTGNFGNLILNSLSGTNAIVEWDQNNQFQSHQIAGTLTIDQGWITLDKSGSISNTTISKLVLTSVNSYLYGHSGNHPGSFQINFGSITNNGGIVYALNDGTGNVVLNVYGDVYNIGNIKIIMNSGVAGAGNGNANFTVNGNFAQSTGDTRIIYNVASSASGVYNCTFGSMTLTGGIFMGQTGCHTGGATCSLTVTNDAIINFTGNADKFRGTSLSSIGANVNNTGFILNVGGNLDFSGPASSEFTTSASYGTESINISGNLIVRGGIFSINYGTSAAAHSSILNVGGAFNISGGSTFLSRNAGSSEQSVAGNLSISAGMLISKGSTGLTNLTITGNYTQSGGMVYLHGNSSLLTTDKISMTIHGNFNQSGGVLSFDDNSSAGSTSHEITLMGSEYSISGTGVITQAGAGTSSVFGKIRFAKNGAIQMQRGEGHQILQAKQEVSAKCTLSVNSGNIQVSSHGTASTTYFRIRSQGQVQLKSGQIYSDGNYQNSGIQVDSAAILSIYSAGGLYNGTVSGSIKSTGNMDYSLDEYSVVEYCGTINQALTGSGFANTSGVQHKYGILRIALSNSSQAIQGDGTVKVRTRLELVEGGLDLNGKSLYLENGNIDAVRRTNGFVKNAHDNSFLIWENISSGTHEFPFGNDANNYTPILFTPVSGFGADVSISTRSTNDADNRPYPSNIITTALSILFNLLADEDVIDRWWNVNAPGVTANVTLHYSSSENTLSAGNRFGPLGMRSWTGLLWTAPEGYGYATASGIGSVTIMNVSHFSNWILAANPAVLPIELALFNATAFENDVRLDWTTTTEINNDFFTIERSEDAQNFYPLDQVQGAGNSTELKIYSYIDRTPLSGRSFYRLKQTDFDGQYTYSEIESIDFASKNLSQLQIENVSPNPFGEYFKVSFNLPENGEVKMNLTNSSGKLISSKSLLGNKGLNSTEYNEGSSLPVGAYILQLIYGKQIVTKKLIKN